MRAVDKDLMAMKVDELKEALEARGEAVYGLCTDAGRSGRAARDLAS